MANLQVWEVLKNAQNAKGDSRRVEILQENNVLAVRDVLKAMYDTRLQILLTPNVPKFTANPAGRAPSNLHKQSPLLRNFYKGLGPAMPQARREKMFIQFLESLCQEEAELAIGLLTRTMPKRFNKITEAIVREAFPAILHPAPEPSRVELPSAVVKDPVPHLDSTK